MGRHGIGTGVKNGCETSDITWMDQDMQQMPFDDDTGHGLGAGPGSAAVAANSGSAAPDADNNVDASKGPAQLPPDTKTIRLAESFRCLEYRPGVRPWDAAILADWVRGGEAIDAQAQAAAFVLEVANDTLAKRAQCTLERRSRRD